MYKTHKIALDPNNKQRTMLAKSAGVARFAYNWGLEKWGEMYSVHKEDESLPKPNRFAVEKKLNEIKHTEFPWMRETASVVPAQAILDLGRAYANFFARRTGFPKPKKKGTHDSFRFTPGNFRTEGRKIRLTRLGWIRMREPLRYEGKLVSATVSRIADRWFVSISVEVSEDPAAPKTGGRTIGVDLGTSEFVLDDGTKTPLPKPFLQNERRLRRAMKAVSRKKEGSANRRKAEARVSRIYAQIANKRTDFMHKYTSGLAKRADTIVIEDISVKSMVENQHFAKAVYDAAFGLFRKQIAYKSEWSGTNLVVADRFFPSSKLCSACGHKRDKLPISKKTWLCPECGMKHDRKINAATNLRNYAASPAATSCGEFFASGRGGSPSPLSSLCEAGTEQQAALSGSA